MVTSGKVGDATKISGGHVLRFGHVGNDVGDSFAMYRLLLFAGRVLMEEGSDAMGEL